MSLPRSLSAPHVGSPSTHGPPHDTRPNGHAKPKITRHSSALVVSNLASPSRPSYATTGITSATGSGHQSPRVEREEDPFSLSGFFPAQLALSNKLRVRSWKWLRSEEEEEVEGGEGEGEGLGERWYGEERMGDDDRFTGEYEVFTGYVSPVSEEDDEWIPSTPGPIFDHHSDEQTLEAIKQEDKLGILSLNDLFSSLEVDEKDEDDIISRGIYSTTPLVSPYYSEDDPLDNEALYSSLCALRRAHTSPPPVVASDDVKGLSCAELFSPAEVTDGEKEDTDLESIVYQGLHKLFALLPF